VDPVRRFIPEALAQILRKAPLTGDKVAFAWRTAVGSALADATTAVLRDDVLHVHARSPHWQREVERSAGLIRSRMDALLGTGVVRAIEVTPPPSSVRFQKSQR
jgi:hypothetical protein